MHNAHAVDFGFPIGLGQDMFCVAQNSKSHCILKLKKYCMYRCQSVPWNTIMGSYGAQLQGDWLHYLLWCDFTDFQARHYSQQEKMLIQFFRKSILYWAWFKNVTDNCYVTLYWWFVRIWRKRKETLWSFGFSGLTFQVQARASRADIRLKNFHMT